MFLFENVYYYDRENETLFLQIKNSLIAHQGLPYGKN